MSNIATTLWLILAIVTQAVGGSLLPITRGFSAPGPTIACLTALLIGFFATSKLIQGGMNLSLIVPIMACLVPLTVVGVAVLVYGEAAPPSKIILLLAAAVAIGLASRIG